MAQYKEINPVFKNTAKPGSPEAIRAGESVEPNEALESSVLDPLSWIGGNALWGGTGNALMKGGKLWRDDVARSIGKGLEDSGRRAANATLAGLGATASSPKQAIWNYLNSVGDAVSMGTPSTGKANAITGMIDNVSNFASDIAALRNYRINKVAGNMDVAESFADTYVKKRIMPYRNTIETIDKYLDGGYEDIKKASILWDNPFIIDRLSQQLRVT